MEAFGGLYLFSTTAIFQLAAASSEIEVNFFSAANFGMQTPNWIQGPGTSILAYDSVTVNNSNYIPDSAAATSVRVLLDNAPPTQVSTTGGASSITAVANQLEITGVLASDATITLALGFTGTGIGWSGA